MIIAVTGFKGGCGKSTITINLAAGLQDQNYSVLIVDADEQGSLMSFAEVAMEGFPTVISIDKPILHKENQVPKLARDYEFTIIDCPPKDSDVIISALTIADVALIPVTPSPLDVWAAVKFKKLLDEAQALRPDLAPFLILSRRKPNTTLGDEGREALGAYKIEVLESEICERIDVQNAVFEGKPLIKYKPNSKAAAEFMALTEEIVAYVKKAKPAKLGRRVPVER
jgi:chromosome partitioning protein